MDTEPLLKVEDLSTYFFTHKNEVIRANDGLEFGVSKGEVVALVGESGCGKSTVALAILRLIKPPGKIVDGRCYFKESDLLRLSENEMTKIRGKEISMVFQNPVTYLNPVKRVGDQIGEVVILHQGADRKNATAKVVEALEHVRIPSAESISKSYPHELSGGMKQRVLIAMAIIGNPSLVILDEPTTALDVTIQKQILELLKDLRNRLRISMILITHDLGIVAEIADRVYVMYAGKIVEHADVFSVFKNPLHPYTKGLLSSVLSINEYKKDLVGISGTVPDLKRVSSCCSFVSRCSYRKEVCYKNTPGLRELEPGHCVACWIR